MNIMFYHICKQFVRPVLSYKHTYARYQHCHKLRLCTAQNIPDYVGLSVDDPQVLKYLINARAEYYDLKRRESLGRDGRERIKELSQIVEKFDCRNALIENLNILNKEMAIEKDVDLLSMMKDESQVIVELRF